MAEWNEVKAKYCDNCQNKEHCYTPCPLVNSALWDLPCEKEIYQMFTHVKSLRQWKKNIAGGQANE